MPYDYRTLSPEAQAALVAHRRRQAYPLHAPPHPYRESGWYLLTAANFEHRPIMAARKRRGGFEARLVTGFISMGAEVGGWVILPNHYHVLVGVNSLDAVSGFLKQLHGTTAREWNLADGMTGQRRVWYKYSDRRIRGERHFCRALNYIHYNPVKHRVTTDPYLWPWSSLFMYHETRGRQWLREAWRNYPVGNFGTEWDD